MEIIWLTAAFQGIALLLAGLHVYELRKKVKAIEEKLDRLTDEVYTIIHVDNEQTKEAIAKLDRRIIGSQQQFQSEVAGEVRSYLKRMEYNNEIK